ncbi:MAG TPA: RNA pseudouridine synthase [Chitinophagales bacterium]|nr:RNA pseudouridine synthase [Chitinophagales bacterium]
MSLSVLYEDNHLIIINKPVGALVQGDRTGDLPISETVKEFIKEKYNKPGDVFLGIIHRLDRPVSGLVIFARTSKALARMNQLFKDQLVKKTYWAVVQNPPHPIKGTIKTYTIKDRKVLKARMYDQLVKNSKECVLDYEVIQQSDRYYLVNVTPHTGRYHQIRAQLAHIGSPIKGDLKYGAKRSNPNSGIHLHARGLEFIHPVKGESIQIIAPVPTDDHLWQEFESAHTK